MILGRKSGDLRKCTRRDRGTPTATAVCVLDDGRDRGIIDRDRGISPGGFFLLPNHGATAVLLAATAVDPLEKSSRLRIIARPRHFSPRPRMTSCRILEFMRLARPR